MTNFKYISLHITFTIMCVVGTASYMLEYMEITQSVNNMKTNLEQVNEQKNEAKEIEREVIISVVKDVGSEKGYATKEDLDALWGSITSTAATAGAAQAVVSEAKKDGAIGLTMQDVIAEIEKRGGAQREEVDLSEITARLETIESMFGEEVDLSDLYAKLDAIEAFDSSALIARLDKLEAPKLPEITEDEVKDFKIDVRDDIDSSEDSIRQYVNNLYDTMQDSINYVRQSMFDEVRKANVPKAVVAVWDDSVVLPQGWVRCGDSGTPEYNDNNFIKGSDTAGVWEDYATALPQSGWIVSVAGDHIHGLSVLQQGSNDGTGDDGWEHDGNIQNANTDSAGSHQHTISGGDDTTRPRNISARFACRLE